MSKRRFKDFSDRKQLSDKAGKNNSYLMKTMIATMLRHECGNHAALKGTQWYY